MNTAERYREETGKEWPEPPKEEDEKKLTKKSFVESLTTFIADTKGLTHDDVRKDLERVGVPLGDSLERIERFIRKLKKQVRKSQRGNIANFPFK